MSLNIIKLGLICSFIGLGFGFIGRNYNDCDQKLELTNNPKDADMLIFPCISEIGNYIARCDNFVTHNKFGVSDFPVAFGTQCANLICTTKFTFTTKNKTAAYLYGDVVSSHNNIYEITSFAENISFIISGDYFGPSNSFKFGLGQDDCEDYFCQGSSCLNTTYMNFNNVIDYNGTLIASTYKFDHDSSVNKILNSQYYDDWLNQFGPYKHTACNKDNFNVLLISFAIMMIGVELISCFKYTKLSLLNIMNVFQGNYESVK
jgi:hypothetical protein